MTAYLLTLSRYARRSYPNTAPSRLIRTVATTSTPDVRCPGGWAMTRRSSTALPDSAVEAFAGVGNPFSLGALKPGERIVDLGSGGGFDCFIAAQQVGSEGRVVGVDMTEEMLSRSRAAAATMGLNNMEFRQGVIEALPIDDGWADVVISNGVINLCADKRQVF